MNRLSTTNRLSVIDEIFLRTHRGLGTPIALQGLWRAADRIDSALLQQVHTALRTGPLGRRVVRPRVPGARRSWRANVRAYPLDFADHPIPVGTLFEWADSQGAQLDPEFEPGWRLSAASLDDGGSVVSLTCSHALADGRALVLAVDDALDRATSTATPVTADDASIPTKSAALESDWADARRQWSIVSVGTARALRYGVPERPDPTAPRSDRTRPGSSPAHSAILQFAVTDWDRAAAAQGATANSLFISMVAHMLWTSGFPDDTIEASLPVDTRDEPRVDNDLAMTEIVIDRADTPATIREKSRIAYGRRLSSPGGMPGELLQVVPDRWAYALSKGAGERDILCSNIGTLPSSLRTLGPHRCTGVAVRAIHPGLAVDTLPRTRLSGYLCRIADDYVLSVVSLDPARINSPTALRDLARKTTASLQLPLTMW
jgi:hypothetical protein